MVETNYELDMSNIPNHIAIIMDGNGRWAKKRFLPRTAGHKAGVEAIREVVKYSNKIGLKYLTLYAFSTENWKRPKVEVDALMNLLVNYLRKELEELNKNNVKITAIGDISKLPQACIDELNKSFEITKSNTGVNLNLALNYGGRDDLINSFKSLGKLIKDGKLDPQEIDESSIKSNLSTSDVPDPDLVIRTSGEQRLSNFLLWDVAYSEFYFTDVLWPDFGEENLRQAIYSYQNRDRRFGGLK